ncbi:MAG: hypothetical protein E6G14_08440 [Actinobacteria bacterium]|nr:MAG: hypothetical protein E6G14_08440 [Actinomycetota bacterium]
MTTQDGAHLEQILLTLRDMVDNARTMPMSASALVNRDEALDLVEDALRTMPDELRHARWLLKERDDFLAQARRDAADLLDAAKVQAARLVERTEVVREAERRARKILDDAEADARRLQHETEDYIDQKLAGFEVALGKTMAAVQRGREQLQVKVESLVEPPSGELEAPVFDQDEM